MVAFVAGYDLHLPIPLDFPPPPLVAICRRATGKATPALKGGGGYDPYLDVVAELDVYDLVGHPLHLGVVELGYVGMSQSLQHVRLFNNFSTYHFGIEGNLLWLIRVSRFPNNTSSIR